MTALRSFALPILVFALAFLAVDYAQNPGRYHQVAIIGTVEPLKPNPNLPTFASVREKLDGRPASAQSPTARSETSPFGPNEHLFVKTRGDRRQSLLGQLYRPWSEYCTADGRKRLASSLDEYFWARGGETLSYPKRFGDDGAAYITQQWSTPDDRRIAERLTDLYQRGYIDLDSVKAYNVPRIKAVLNGARMQASPCSG